MWDHGTVETQDELRKVSQVSVASIALGLLSLAILLLDVPAPWQVSARVMTWSGLAMGVFAGVGAMTCAVYLRRKGLALPAVTIAALVVGGLSLACCLLLATWVFYYILLI